MNETIKLNFELLFQLYQIMGSVFGVFSKTNKSLNNFFHNAISINNIAESLPGLKLPNREFSIVANMQVLSYFVIKYIKDETEEIKYIIFLDDNEINAGDLKEVISHLVKDVSPNEKAEFILISKALEPLFTGDKPLNSKKLSANENHCPILNLPKSLQTVKNTSKALYVTQYNVDLASKKVAVESGTIKNRTQSNIVSLPMEKLIAEDSELAAFNLKLIFLATNTDPQILQNQILPFGIVGYYFESKKAEALKRKKNIYKKKKVKYLTKIEKEDEEDQENFFMSQ